MVEVIKCMGIMDACYTDIRGLTIEGFQMLLGVLVDQYCSDHGFNTEETCKMLRDLSEVPVMVHDELGMMSPTVKGA